MDVQVASGLAAVASQEYGLSVLSVSNPALPVALGGAHDPFDGLHVARAGTRAVVTGQTDAGLAQLWVVDMTNTARPVVQGQLVTSLNQTAGSGFLRVAITADGHYAVAAMGTSGLWVIDVSTPTAPTVVGTLALGSIAYAVALNAAGTHAYVALSTVGMKVVSLASPSAPALVGSATVPSRNYRDIAVVGTLAFLANQNGTMDVYNVATPTAPFAVGAVALSGFGLHIAAEGTAVSVITETSTASQLDAVDVSVPGTPVKRSTTSLGVPGTGQGVALSGGLSYVAANTLGIRIYDTTQLTPPLRGSYVETFLPRNVAVKGTRAVTLGTYLPTNQMRFKVLDVTNSNAPVVQGELATTVAATGATGVALTPTAALAVAAMGGSGLWVVDVSTPTAPVLRGSVALGGFAWGVALNSTGTHAFVATATAGMKVVSLANPAAPVVVATALPASRNYRDIAVSGSFAYLANQGGTMDIFNIATPTAPVAVGALPLSGFGLRIAAAGTLVTAITEISTASQMDVIDVTTPGAPVRRSMVTLGVPGTGLGIARSGSQAFVATGSGGLRIYELADPTDPVLRVHGLVVGDANAVTVQNTTAYVADFPATLDVVCAATSPFSPNWAHESTLVALYQMEDLDDPKEEPLLDTSPATNHLSRGSCAAALHDTTHFWDRAQGLKDTGSGSSTCSFDCQSTDGCTDSDFHFATGGFTCGAYVRPTAPELPANVTGTIMGTTRKHATPTSGWRLYQNFTPGNGTWGVDISNGGTQRTLTSSASAALNTQRLLVTRYNGSTGDLGLFVDGLLDTFATSVTSPGTTGAEFQLFGWLGDLGEAPASSSDGSFQGTLDMAFCFRRVLDNDSLCRVEVCGVDGTLCTCNGTAYVTKPRHILSGGAISCALPVCNKASPTYLD